MLNNALLKALMCARHDTSRIVMSISLQAIPGLLDLTLDVHQLFKVSEWPTSRVFLYRMYKLRVFLYSMYKLRCFAPFVFHTCSRASQLDATPNVETHTMEACAIHHHQSNFDMDS